MLPLRGALRRSLKMREPFLVVASVIGFALLVFAPSKASACGLYYDYATTATAVAAAVQITVTAVPSS
jgi:hypothetical protein